MLWEIERLLLAMSGLTVEEVGLFDTNNVEKQISSDWIEDVGYGFNLPGDMDPVDFW